MPLPDDGERLTATRWRVRVIAPGGRRDGGSLTSIVIDEPPTPQQIADALAEIAWRAAYDMAREASAEAATADAES